MGGFFLSTRVFVLGVAIAVAAIAAGCGSSGSGGSTESAGSGEITVETGSLSKADFIKKANAICEANQQEFQQKLALATKNNASQSDPSAMATEMVDEGLVPIYEGQIEQISALGAPKGDEDLVAAYLEAIQEGLESAHANPIKTVQRLTPFGKAIVRAKAYGLRVCAESLG